MCNTLNIKVLELYCNIKKWNIELDTLIFNIIYWFKTSGESFFRYYVLL